MLETYRSTSLGFPLTGLGTGEELAAGKLDVAAAAPTTLTAAFLNLNALGAAAGWTARLPRAS
jgi:hypothetical protein